MAFDSAGKWSMEDDGVASRIAAITSGGSPVMKQAETAGMQSANRRGLGNSSMAVGAAQSEVIRAATPIASQEAQQVAQKNLTEMGSRQQTAINDANIAQQTAMQGREFAQQNSMADKDLAGRIQLQDKSTAAAIDLAKLNNDQQDDIVSRQIAAQERERIAASLTDLSAQRMNATANTLQNDKIPATARSAAQSSFNDQYQSTVNYLQNLYGVSVTPQTPTPAPGYYY